MTKEELEKEAEEKTTQYMNEHTEKYNCENTKLETDNYNTGREYGYEDGYFAGAESREKLLTEAKALLIGFISKMKDIVRTPYEKDLIERAEQFLQEVEK